MRAKQRILINQIMDQTISSSLNDNRDNKRMQFLQQCSPIFIEYQLMREFVLFQQQNMSHIYIVPSNSSPFRWFGVMFIHNGLYRGLIARFTIVIASSYPDCECPKIYFDPIPFHPLVNPLNGELNTSKTFENWKSSSNQIWQIILYAKQTFHAFDINNFCDENLLNSSSLNSPFNVNALKLYKDNFEAFQQKVSKSIADCNEKLNDANKIDSNSIVFGPWSDESHKELRSKLLSGVNIVDEMQCGGDPTHPSATGLSWVQRGSMQMFSKSNS